MKKLLLNMKMKKLKSKSQQRRKSLTTMKLNTKLNTFLKFIMIKQQNTNKLRNKLPELNKFQFKELNMLLKLSLNTFHKLFTKQSLNMLLKKEFKKELNILLKKDKSLGNFIFK